MKEKRKTPALVMALACLLLLASLAALLLPWLKLAVDTNSGRMDVSEVLSLLGQDKDSILALAGQELADSGVPVPGGTLREMLAAVLDGEFSLPTLARLSGQAGDLCASMGEPAAARTADLVGYGIWGLLGLLALLGLIALICVLTDHRGGIVPYLLLSVLAAAAVVLARAGANRYLEEQGKALLDQWGAGMLLSYFGVDLHVVKMGIAAYLCPFLALLALLFMGIKKRSGAPARREAASPYPARRSAESGSPLKDESASSAQKVWTCPTCGSIRGDEEGFCIRCGTEKPKAPAAKSCPICGKKLPPDAAFCSACGAKL